MNKEQFRAWLESKRACSEAMKWLDTLEDQSPENVWETCQRGDWLLWWHRRTGTEFAVLEPVVRRCVNRALEYAKVDYIVTVGTKDDYLTARKHAYAADAAYAYAAAAAAYAAYAADAAAAARQKDLGESADDCRELLTMPVMI